MGRGETLAAARAIDDLAVELTPPHRLTNKERWEQAKAILADALEFTSKNEQQEFIRARCGQDAELLAEVESLLEQPTTGFDQCAADAGASLRNESYPTRTRVGRYEIIHELGRGGMGAVYLARRADGEFDKLVALKLLKRGTDTDEVLRRFREERLILARLVHPNIAGLLDAGTSDDGLPYFVMEYVDGVAITTYASTHHAPVAARLRLFQAACEAVSYAHRNLVIHRDLKPSNVLVTKEGELKLLDFGIAKLLETTDNHLTLIPQRAMTPEYASPEQLTGEPITTVSDVYSLGILLYELLTGARPYRLRTRQPEELARTIAIEAAEAPSTVGGKILRGDLDNIVLKAIQKEPERRYSSADELSADIRRYLEGLPVRARKDTASYRAQKFVRRHKAGVAAVCIIALCLIGGIVSTAWQAHRAKQQQERAEFRFNQVRRLAHSVLFDYHDRIANLPGSTEVRRRLVSDALEYLDNLWQEAGSDLSLSRELATAYQKVAQVQGNSYYANLGDTAGAMKSYQSSLTLREKLLASDPMNVELQNETADSYQGIGDMFYTDGQLEEGLRSYRHAAALREKALAAAPNDVGYRLSLSELYTHLGDIEGMEGYANLGDTAAALEAYRKARELLEPIAGARPDDQALQSKLATVLSHLGMLYDVTGDVTSALAIGRQAVDELEHLANANRNNQSYRSSLLAAQAFLHYALIDSRQYDEAVAQSNKSVSELETFVEKDSQNALVRRSLGVAYNSLGADLLKMSDVAGALQNHGKALQIAEHALQADAISEQAKADVAYTLHRLGEAQAAAGEQATAIGSYRRALELRESTKATNLTNLRAREELAGIYLDLARALQTTNQNGEARANLEKARALAAELAQHSPNNVRYRSLLQEIEAQAGSAK